MIKGIGASDGICIGKVYKYEQVELVVEKLNIDSIEAELARFEDAIDTSTKEIQAIKDNTASTMDEETAAIFGAHLEILADPELIGGVKSMIEADAVNADFALKTVSDNFVAIFEAMDNEYIRERAADIKDVSKRVLGHIQGVKGASLADIAEEVVVVARDLTPSDTAQLDKNLVQGFITNIGGRTSHSAIMARTLEIPAVVGTNHGFEKLEDGQLVMLNGSTGEIIPSPTEEEISDYKEKMAALEELKALWATFKDSKTETADGAHVDLAANIGSPDDVEGVLKNGGEGVGLYRTEFLYMGKPDFPTEEEQLEAYKAVLENLAGKPVVVRTLDIGGDKELDYMVMEHELNPFLGNRALRLCLNKPEMFKVQLRALLRASVYGDLHIMFPMIATVDEFRQARNFLKDVEKELREEGLEVSDDYKLGIMIEIPAAAVAADILAKEVDFFSIGTNDLIQYTFAADRMNENVSYLYQPFNPSLLRLIKMVADAANAEGKWAGMCGEMAGEEKALPLLIGLGLKELSMSAPSILRSRCNASKMTKADCQALVAEALKAANQEEVLTLVDAFFEKLNNGGIA